MLQEKLGFLRFTSANILS